MFQTTNQYIMIRGKLQCTSIYFNDRCRSFSQAYFIAPLHIYICIHIYSIHMSWINYRTKAILRLTLLTIIQVMSQ